MNETNGPLLLPVAKVAALTGLTPRHLRGMSKRGQFPATVKCGKHTMYATEAVRIWLAAAKALPAVG